jgi:pilus assembly protein CpaE
VKIAVISQKQQLLDTIYEFLTEFDSSHSFFAGSDKDNPHKILTINGNIQQVPAVAEQEHPDLLLLEGSADEADELQILERVTARFPRLGVIMLCSNQSPERLMQAMRVGVREALPSLPTREILLDAVDRFQQRIKQASIPVKQGKVLAFIPCKGGSGATFLASNLAYTLAAEENKRVALIDFNLQLGDASLFLSDSMPLSSIADVTRQIHRLDGAFLASSMMQILPNLGVLASPNEPEKATEILPEHVAPLIQVALKNYDFVILDIGRRMDAVSIQALDKADMIFPVIQQTLPFIRDTKRLIDVFHSLGYGEEKLRLIVNRYDKKSEITLEDIKNTLRIPVFKSIPNNYSVVEESVNHGVPVIKIARRSPIAKMLLEIGAELGENNEQGGRWLKKLFSM